MGRKVEYDIYANDKTAAALAASSARFIAEQKKITAEAQKTQDKLGKGLGDAISKNGPGILGKAKDLFASIGLSGGQLLASGLGAASPVVAGVISAAIIGGVGIGVAGIGVALAAQDPRVKAAGAQLGKSLGEGLRDDAASFVEPTLDAINQVEGAYASMSDRIESTFEGASGFVEPLLSGLIRGTDGVLSGIEDLVAQGGPVIDQLGNTFEILGDSTGRAFSTMAGGADDAATALRGTAEVMGAVIEVGGLLVRGLTEIVGVAAYLPQKIIDAQQAMGLLDDETKLMGDLTSRTATSTGALAASVDQTSTAAALATPNLQSMADATRAIYEANNALYGSETATATAIANATEKIKENGKTLSLNTEKGRENRGAVSDVAGALQRQYDAYVAVNGVGPKSAAVADTLRGKFIGVAQKAGLASGAAKDLADELLDIPSSRDTKITVQNEQALEAARDTRRALESVKSRTVELRVKRTGEKLYGNQASAFAGGNTFWTGSPADGLSRTGGPTPVELSSSVNVYLDGAPFYGIVSRATKASSARAAWRTKVGMR